MRSAKQRYHTNLSSFSFVKQVDATEKHFFTLLFE